MYKIVEPFCEPHEIINHMEEGYCEMSPEEHGFLCGLIKEKSPNKIVEVGVAGGGTTAVIMKCLDMVNPSAKMYSCDLNKICYRRKDKMTGYQLDEVKEELGNYSNHKLLLGGILPQFMEQIGNNIDLCVLDTVHAMPGEILDFLTILPYLSDGAVCILHDTANNLLGKYKDAFATKILFDSVYAEKYYDFLNANLNIGAFVVDNRTREYIANVFSSLSITWAYEPTIRELMAYRDVFKKFYDEECLTLFDIFWEMNHEMLLKK
ncbi:MAG: class I SAM-dependent methyltransferase [Lachnospiraceae bacterium]|nr:class I SAM-dependent methyltransferase [Lachnospiraceae bacterium]